MKTTSRWLLVCLLVLSWAMVPVFGEEPRHEICFPDIEGYRTLACDLHTHTVFSDGDVWPTVRVGEAWRQGLDVISITDHIEYQPHKNDVPTNHNRPYELAEESAKHLGLLLVKGTEITRDTPPGHFNAIFLKDIQPLDMPDFVEAIKQANQQGAFVFWNHQGWKGEEKGSWLDVHTTLYDNHWLHGMEVCNAGDYFPTAHRWCLEKNLTMLGNTDIHAPDLRSRSTSANHRTMTLVFAKEQTPEAVQEALRAGRTVVWFKDRLIGRKEWLEPLFAACVEVEKPHHRSGSQILVRVQNHCEADIDLKRIGDVGPSPLHLPAGTTSLVSIDLKGTSEPITLEYTAENFLIEPGKGLPVTLCIPQP